MALDLRLSLIQCRLLLRKSSVTFAERKATLINSSGIGLTPLRSPDSFLAARSPAIIVQHLRPNVVDADWLNFCHSILS